MQYSFLLIATLAVGQPDSLTPGTHERTITVDKLKRTHLIHVPSKYDPKKPTPVVLALHGATMIAKFMELGTGLSKTADDNGFIVVYPNGTGFIQTWNAGSFPGDINKADDIKYLGKVLDDVEAVCNVDTKRVYATGLSNGAMMCYRLASEMSERIACIAPVAGTMAIEKYEPKRPVPVMHFHGTKDLLVPYLMASPIKRIFANFLRFRSVDDTVTTCVKANGCAEKPTESEAGRQGRKAQGDAQGIRRRQGEGRGHSLYHRKRRPHLARRVCRRPFLGPSTKNFSANDTMWEFFKKHALK